MDMAPEKEYFAFISYQRKDEEWADRLRNKLEHYRLPSNVRKQDASLPKEIRPIFRDALELAGGVLAKEIETALQNSKFLIVICSPNSAKSPWVNKEIQTFIDLGREDHIIPFIIDGTPFADNPDSECFPPALRSLKGEKELLGININELSRDAASIKVVARMFGLKFDTLWQRYEREQRKRLMYIIAAVVLFALVSLGIGAYFVRQNSIIQRQKMILQKDSVILANHLEHIRGDSVKLAIQNDSIARQNKLILKQRDDLDGALRQLLLSNRQLVIERDNVLKANWGMMENQARAVAEICHSLTEDGDVLPALRLLMSLVPKDLNHPERPMTPELERELRRAFAKLEQGKVPIARLGIPVGGNTVSTFNKDGSRLYFTQEKHLYVYNTRNGQIIDDLSFANNIYGLSLSADEKYLMLESFNERNSTRTILDLNTMLVKFTLDLGPSIFSSCQPVCGGKYIASCVDSTYSIWNWQGELLEQKKMDRAVTNLTFSADEKSMAVTTRGKTRVFDAKTHQCKYEIEVRPSLTSAAGFSHDGSTLITGSLDSVVHVWNGQTGKYRRAIVLADRLRSAYLNNRGDLMVTLGNSSNIIEVWNTATGVLERQIGKGKLYERDNTVFALLENDGLKIINPFTGKMVLQLPVEEEVDAFDINFKQRLAVIATKEGNAHLWSLQNNKTYKVLAHSDYSKNIFGKRYMIRNKCWNRDGSLFATVGSDNIVALWAYPSFNKVATFAGHTQEIYSVCFDASEQRLLTCSYDSTARVWSIAGKKQLLELKHDKSLSMACYINHDNQIITTAEHEVMVWDALTGELQHRFSPTHPTDSASELIPGISDNICAVIYIPDKQQIVASYFNGAICVWSLYNSQIVKEERVHQGRTEVTLSPDEKIYASWAYGGQLYLWNAATHKRICELKGHTGDVYDAIFLQDGKSLVSSAGDGRVLQWDINQGVLMRELSSGTGGIQHLTLDRSGRFIIALTNEKKLVVIDLQKGNVVMEFHDKDFYTCPVFDMQTKAIVAPMTDGWINGYQWLPMEELIGYFYRMLGDIKLTPQEMRKHNIY